VGITVPVAGPQRTSVRIETHGCKLNAADSQALARRFLEAGYVLVHDDGRPDVYVLNTCTVTHVADRKARHALAAARRRYPGALIVAAGCLAERVQQEVEGLPAVDLVVPNRTRDSLVALVGERLGGTPAPRPFAGRGCVQEYLLGRTRAHLKIQEGCDLVCTYCIVPRVRGRQCSVAEKALVEEVARLAGDGCREVVLTGTRPGSYGFDVANGGLAALLRRLLSETDVQRVRVSSLQPLEITDELLGLWTGAGTGRLCPHFHLPLQSGSDAVLSRMRRRYTQAQFVDAVGRVRQAVPGASITTDLIAGFPGETGEDHRATLAVMGCVRFAGAHVFPYSRRPGTAAAHLAGHLRPETKAGRAAELRGLAARHAEAHRRRFVGAVRQVLWEGRTGETGLTDNYLRVRRMDGRRSRVPGTTTAGNDVIEDVELVALDGDVLVGRPLGSPEAVPDRAPMSP